MYTSPLLQTPPPNVHRVTGAGNFKPVFSKAFPPMLRGIMSEPEYADYIWRIENAARVSKVPFMLFTLIPILFACNVLVSVLCGDFMVGMVTGFVWFFLSAGIMFGTVYCVSKNSKQALSEVEAVTSEINQRFYSRGVKWTFVPGTKHTQCYVDIVLFSPNSTTVTADPWAGVSSTATAPPPTTGYMATAPPQAYGTTFSYPGYPSAPPPTGATAPPSYPGDPSRPYGY